MNQFYRALQMPPRRLLRKLLGEKEVYTIAVRPRPTAEGTEPLPALDGGAYTPLPGRVCRPAALPPRRPALAFCRGNGPFYRQGPYRGLRAA